MSNPAPFPSNRLLVDDIVIEYGLTLREGVQQKYKTAHSRAPIDLPAKTSVPEVKGVLAAIADSTTYSTVVRVELIKDTLLGHGMLLYNDEDELLVHVLHARFDGSKEEVNLAILILSEIKISNEIISKLQDSIQGSWTSESGYKIVVWRSSRNSTWPQGWAFIKQR